jgi:hypothetical protein
VTLSAEPDGTRLSDSRGDVVTITPLGSARAPSPRLSPDGQRLALRLEQQGQPAGVYVDGALLQPDKPPPDPTQPELLPDLVFEPLEWSPDGTKLLLASSIPGADYCGMAVKDLVSGALVALAPSGALTNCGAATWSDDGASILLTLQDAGASAALLPGLWRAEPVSGTVTLLLPETLDGVPALYAAPRQLANGDILVFVARMEGYDPLAYPPAPVLFTMMRFPAGEQQPAPLRQDAEQIYRALWAPDASGAVVLAPSGGEDPDATALFWLPAGGAAVVRLPVSAPQQMWWGMPSAGLSRLRNVSEGFSPQQREPAR